MEKIYNRRRFADSHAHLNNPDFSEDIDRLAESLRDMLILNVAYDLDSAERAVALAEKYENMSAGVGVHPNDCASLTEADFVRLADLSRHERVVAVGETGLDYFRNRTDGETQKRSLRRHLRLAAELNKPMIIHCRDAFKDILPILKEDASTGGVLHCFSEGPAEAEAGLKLGFHISFAGNITYPNAERLRESAKVVPPEYLLIETDCPYLAPQPVRGKRNDPSFVIETAKTVAAVRGVSVDDVARVTYRNFQKLFLGVRPGKAEIVYRIRDSLYVNVTSQCSNVCIFCPRLDNPVVQGHYLGMERDPSAEEIIGTVGEQRPSEVVLCGFGEPTMRLDVIKQVAAAMKRKGLRVRLDTNGQGSLINGRDIVPELVGLVDSVSISLNAADAKTYNHICVPLDSRNAFEEVCAFITRARDLLPETTVSAVDLPEGVDISAVREFAEKTLRVKFRLRAYDMVG